MHLVINADVRISNANLKRSMSVIEFQTAGEKDCVVRISLVFVSMMYVLNHIGMMEQIKIAEIIRIVR